jgi:hypothetical protein
MTNDKIEDSESSAPTLKPKATALSQRPTIPVPVIKTKETDISKQYHPVRYKFYLIGALIVAIIICAILLITRPLQSYSMPQRSIFNLSPIVIPTDSAQIKSIQVTPAVPSMSVVPIEPVAPKVFKKIEVKKEPADKDYGI